MIPDGGHATKVRNVSTMGSQILFSPKVQSPAVDGNARWAPSPSSRHIPNNANILRDPHSPVTAIGESPVRPGWSAFPFSLGGFL